MTKYLVFGGAGFLGSHLVDKLLENTSNKVVVYDNLYRGTLKNLAHHCYNSNLEFVHGDIRDYNKITEYIRGSSIVYHLAAQSNVVGSTLDSAYTEETNILGTANIAMACKNFGVSQLIFTSSREVYGNNIGAKEHDELNPSNLYGHTKFKGECIIRDFLNNTDVVCKTLRLSNVYGSRDFGRVIPLWIKEFKKDNGKITIYGGKQIIDFVHVSIVVKAFLKASETNLLGQTINIGSGKGTTLQELHDKMYLLFGNKSVELEVLPKRDFETQNYVANIDRMKSLLGIYPNEDPLHGLEKMIKGDKV